MQLLPFWRLREEPLRDIQQVVLPMPLGKTQIQREREIDQDHIIGFNWKHARIRILTLLQIMSVGQISDFITQALECLPVIVG